MRASVDLHGSSISDNALQTKTAKNTTVVEHGRPHSMGNPSWASQQAHVRKDLLQNLGLLGDFLGGFEKREIFSRLYVVRK